ncbi:MAG: alanine dehydrogenase [Bacteroidetes bacterium]|nr:alanine dehydrogenase [Bacteroidota bacterium]
MRIGIPTETHFEEKRVGLTPSAVDVLVKSGHKVFVQSGAGLESHFTDENYRDSGADIVYDVEEVYHRAEMLAKIAPLSEAEADLLQPGQTLFSFLHLAITKKNIVQLLLDKKITAIGYELIEHNGEYPVQQAMSEIAGPVSIQVAERFLGSDNPESRGVLLGGLTGVAPAAVVIIGAGVAGYHAAKAALGRGAQVIILDIDQRKLRKVKSDCGDRVTTVLANPYTIARGAKFADVLIGAVQVKAEKSPHIITEDTVASMKKGAVIVDLSIDQGGCVETSRPTTLSQPVFVEHGVLHYCVPNMPALVSRTASYGLTNAAIPYIFKIAEEGLANAIMGDSGLANGVCTYNGFCSNTTIADSLNIEYRRLHLFPTN